MALQCYESDHCSGDTRRALQDPHLPRCRELLARHTSPHTQLARTRAHARHWCIFMARSFVYTCIRVSIHMPVSVSIHMSVLILRICLCACLHTCLCTYLHTSGRMSSPVHACTHAGNDPKLRASELVEKVLDEIRRVCGCTQAHLLGICRNPFGSAFFAQKARRRQRPCTRGNRPRVPGR